MSGNMIQDNVRKPRFCKSLPLGEKWSSKSMVRIIPEQFVGSTQGAFEHRLVFSVRWGNSWQLWLHRDKNGLFMEEEDWDEFVNDNFLAPNDVLLFTHQDTIFIDVRIYKQDSHHLTEITSAPLQAAPQAQVVVTPNPPQSSPSLQTPVSAPASSSGARQQVDALVKNPEQYLSNPSNPFFVKTLGKKIDVLYVSHLVTDKYGLKFGPHNSPMFYLLPNEKIEAATKIYGGCACFNGWAAVCRKYKLKQGDSVVCELECSQGVVTAVRLHFPYE